MHKVFLCCHENSDVSKWQKISIFNSNYFSNDFVERILFHISISFSLRNKDRNLETNMQNPIFLKIKKT